MKETYQQLQAWLPRNEMFGAGILLVAGFFMGRLARKFNLPSICGYIVAGLLCGPYVAGLVHADVVARLEPVPQMALGLIALTIGAHFSRRRIRQLGWGKLILTLTQMLTTFLVVSLGMRVLGMGMVPAVLLGAISAAIAPGAALSVVTEMKARGKLVDTLLATTALDDAGCILLFAFAVSLGGALSGHDTSILGGFLSGAMHVFFSILLGVVVGLLLNPMVTDRRDNNEIVMLVLGFNLLCSGISLRFHLSPLLANMVLGFVLVNAASKNERLFRLLEPIATPLYGVFFALAGAELHLPALASVGVLGTAFILLRFSGKYSGAYLGGVITRSPALITRYLGLCLFPQAGIAIGLMMMVLELPDAVVDQALKNQMHTIILASVLVSELIGPPLVRFALLRSGEAYTGGT